MFFGLEHLQKLQPYIKSNNELQDFKYFALERLRLISKVLPVGSTLRLEIAPNNGFYNICLKTLIFKGPEVKEVSQSPNIFLALASCQNKFLDKVDQEIKHFGLQPLQRTPLQEQQLRHLGAEGELLHYPMGREDQQQSADGDHPDQKSS